MTQSATIPLMAKPLEYNATLISRTDLTETLAIFTIKPDADLPPAPWFESGQYCVIGMNNEVNQDKGSVRRAMSIASSPHETAAVEFYIRYVTKPESDNPLTHLLWKCNVGERLYLRPNPTGKFTIKDIQPQPHKTCIMVAAGTGAAPFVSIVRSRLADNPKADLSKFVLLHAASYADDIGYKAEMESVASSNGLHYFPSISRPSEGDGWTHAHGRVEDFFLPERLTELEKSCGTISPETSFVMVCGLTGTVGNCIERLLHRGFTPDNRRIRKALDITGDPSLFYEQYDKTPPLNVKDEAVVARLRQLMPS